MDAVRLLQMDAERSRILHIQDGTAHLPILTVQQLAASSDNNSILLESVRLSDCIQITSV